MKIDVSEIKSRLTCSDVLSRHGIQFTGQDICCPLPGHDDSRPSFGIFDEGKAFRCHGCDRGGDAIQLHRELTGQDFPTALETLAEWANLEPTEEPKKKKGFGKIVQSYDYTDEAGNLLFQVCRMEPKDFRQRAPNGEDGWTWKTKNIRRVLYRLPDVLKAVKAGEPVYFVEGEKDVHALVNLGFCGTCNPGGAGKWRDDFSEALRGADVVLIADKDEPGRKHAAKVAGMLHGIAARVRVLELPDRNEKPVKDAADWCDAGGTRDELLDMVENVPEFKNDAQSTETDIPVLFVPDGGEYPVPLIAGQAGGILAGTERYFMRAGIPVEVNPEGIKPIHPAELVSELQPPICQVLRKSADGNVPTMFSESRCKSLLHARRFKKALPEIRHLTSCPVLVPDIAGGVRLVESFDPESGCMVRGWDGGPVPEMDTTEAAQVLVEILKDFDFPTENDMARAIALLLTPAFLAGQLFGMNARAPVGLIEADASQTGKGYLTRLIGALYAEKIRTVTQRKGGVGSVEESFSSAVYAGASMLLLDNLRGGLDSPLLESATTEPLFECRVPYRDTVPVDVRRVFLLLTSNKAELSRDMANRACAVRLRKRPPGFQFTKYPQGDVLTHVESNRARYIGAVLAIVRHWWEAGRPHTDEGRHSFRAWVQPMDWIIQNVFELPPLLDGHTEAQERVADPGLQWLREICLAVERAGILERALIASDILEVCIEGEIDIPGSDGSGGEDEQRKMLQGIGRKFAPRFRDGQPVEVDGYQIERTVSDEPDGKGHYVKSYTFSRKKASPIPLLSPIPPISPKTLNGMDTCISGDSGNGSGGEFSETIGAIGEHRGNRGNEQKLDDAAQESLLEGLL